MTTLWLLAAVLASMVAAVLAGFVMAQATVRLRLLSPSLWVLAVLPQYLLLPLAVILLLVPLQPLVVVTVPQVLMVVAGAVAAARLLELGLAEQEIPRLQPQLKERTAAPP